MKLDARTLNLLGLLAIVAVLGLGAVTVIMPLFDGVKAAEGELATAEQTNETFRAQLTVLSDAEGRQAEIEQNLAGLREEMPDKVQGDTILQAIADASKKTTVFIDSDVFGETETFTPRTAAGADEAAVAAEPAPPADPGATEGDAEAGATAEASAVPTGDPRQQIEITLSVSVKDAAMATRFLDELRSGQRSLLVTSATLQRGSEHAVTGWDGNLSVTLLAFLYTDEVAQG